MTMQRRTATNAELEEELERLTEKVDKLSASIDGLVKAWEGATFLVAAVKWMGSFVLAVSAFWFVVTHFGQGK